MCFCLPLIYSNNSIKWTFYRTLRRTLSSVLPLRLKDFVHILNTFKPPSSTLDFKHFRYKKNSKNDLQTWLLYMPMFSTIIQFSYTSLGYSYKILLHCIIMVIPHFFHDTSLTASFLWFSVHLFIINDNFWALHASLGSPFTFPFLHLILCILNSSINKHMSSLSHGKVSLLEVSINFITITSYSFFDFL